MSQVIADGLIEIFNKENPDANDFPVIKNVIIGINYDREIVRNRITLRLKELVIK